MFNSLRATFAVSACYNPFYHRCDRPLDLASSIMSDSEAPVDPARLHPQTQSFENGNQTTERPTI